MYYHASPSVSRLLQLLTLELELAGNKPSNDDDDGGDDQPTSSREKASQMQAVGFR